MVSVIENGDKNTR